LQRTVIIVLKILKNSVLKGGALVRIGLTGGPGSGKSTVAGILKTRGIAFTDLDYLSRVAVEPGRPAFKKIVEYFGDSVVDKEGGLDRSTLRRKLIKNSNDKKILEKIIHPEVFILLGIEEEKNRKAGEKIFFVEAPLLFEAGMEQDFDFIVTVYCPFEVQVKRIMERDMVGYDDATALVNSQMQLGEKAEKADFVICNDKTTETLERQVDQLLIKFD